MHVTSIPVPRPWGRSGPRQIVRGRVAIVRNRADRRGPRFVTTLDVSCINVDGLREQLEQRDWYQRGQLDAELHALQSCTELVFLVSTDLEVRCVGGTEECAGSTFDSLTAECGSDGLSRSSCDHAVMRAHSDLVLTCGWTARPTAPPTARR